MNDKIFTIKIAICDDEQEIHRSIEEVLTAYDSGQSVKLEIMHAYSAMELLEWKDTYSAVFLDIEMPGMDGIKVKEILQHTNPHTNIIFLTSHDERVMEAFGRNVVGFVTKPVEKEKILPILGKVVRNACEMIVEIDVADTHRYICANQIRYIKGQDKYTEVFTTKERFMIRKSLAEWELLLSPVEFCRVNRSYIIHFDLFDGRRDEIILDDGKKIKLSRKNKREITEKYKQFLREKMGQM